MKRPPGPPRSSRSTSRTWTWSSAGPGPPPGDMCPHTGRARLGYDRARVLLDTYAGLDLHQLRHSAATHLGEAEVPPQLIMGKTRHKSHALRQTRP
ncbi:hypothetical protein [Microtetraspora sp. NBRC 13810]|uniref:hypothetical protein n=1 Tax=Microtetraspora sp. NBRC 13810 TaxID=3030990 RepID=UPI00255735FE|nr:hypothetical protein [Microtetraspora sp. NBRC 13810]